MKTSFIKWLSALSLLLFAPTADARVTLSDSATLSLLTCGAGDNIYSVYGHTALRVCDPSQDIDYVFNYGLFDFDAPCFVYRFAKGDTRYRLGGTTFARFLREYALRGSAVTEQTLNLSAGDRQAIFEALVENSQPQNCEYLYNFFYDNCSTRPRLLVEKHISGTIRYPDLLPPATFRDIVHRCNRGHPWFVFGIELALGAPLDRTATPTEQLFIPDNLMRVFAAAEIVSPDGAVRPLVSATRELSPALAADAATTGGVWHPTLICWLFFALTAGVTLLEYKTKRKFRLFDAPVFLLYGLTGCLIAFLSFVSIHPAVFPNFSIVWANPLHLVPAATLLIAACRRFNRIYMSVNFVVLLLLAAGWWLAPQEFNPAFLPLTLALCLRSGAESVSG